MKAQAEALVASLARTFIPAVVGSILGWFATSGLQVDPALEGLLTVVFMAGFTGLYYAAVRFVEEKFPWVGILLGYAKSPDSYSKGQATPGELSNETTLNLTVINPKEPESVTDAVQAAMDRVKDGPDHRLE